MSARCEVLSPVGSMDAMYASINSGADAIYLAGELYGARKASDKFSVDDIKFIIDTCHRYKVKVYVTVNTLIFDNEIDDLIEYTDKLYLMGVDAFLIQDMGLINIFSKRYKDLDLHISTQANTKTLEEIKFYESIPNIKRVVLARETPISEIKRIKENSKLEIEVFVHGAICMSYSGNCLISSMLFKRSGNRGECAQPCRLKYSLYEDNKEIESEKYLLSPKELNTIERVDELIKIGVNSLKIEGRIKSKEYVALTTSIYKEKVLNPNRLIKDIEIDNLKRAYNREFTSGYIFNTEPKDIVNTFRPNNMGLFLGDIIDNKDKIRIKLDNDLCRLDGIRIISNTKEDYGMIVDRIFKDGVSVNKAYKGDTVLIESYKMPKFDCKGLKVYQTSSEELKEELKDKTNNSINKKCVSLDLYIKAKLGENLELRDNVSGIKIKSDFIVNEALKVNTKEEDIYYALNKLENTPYYINSIEYDLDNNVYVALGAINALRRELLNRIDDLNHIERKINYDYSFDSFALDLTSDVYVKVETKEQLDCAIENGFNNIYVCDINLYNEYKNNGLNIKYSKPRIIENYKKYDSYSGIISEVGSCIKDNDISEYLNVTNIYSANFYFNKGARNIYLSLEIDRDNVLMFSDRYKEAFNNKPNIGVVIYSKVDLMIMKYCLLSAHYKTSKGCNKCLNKTIEVKDRNGEVYKVLKTDTCGNRIINSKALCLFEYINNFKNSGINNFLIEFSDENKDECSKVLGFFKEGKTLSGSKYTYGRF